MPPFWIGLLLIIFVSSACVDAPHDGLSHDQEATLLYLGDSISTAAQKVVLQYVSEAMQARGADHAVAFCNTHAMEITDSLAQGYRVGIQRLSDKNRNPQNAIQSETDKAAWERIQQTETGQMAHVLLEDGDGRAHYYKPIFIAIPTCLQCHGGLQGEVAGSTLGIIRQKYPEDKAVGYAMGDLRGMWKITLAQDN